MDYKFPLGLSFDDVLLIPQYSEVDSRKNISLKTRFSKNIFLDIPLTSANMDTVTEAGMAIAMAEAGGLGVIHRFLTIDQQVEEIRKVKKKKLKVAAAVGVREGTARARALVAAGADVLVLDIAHGHHNLSYKILKEIKGAIPNIDIVAGNVATAEATEYLIKAGADAVKIGIGPGSLCSTRIMAGSGVPQITAILECAKVGHKYDIPVIADGGLKNSGDVAKALAAGASTILSGTLFAGTDESPGKVARIKGKKVKLYRGMASREASIYRDGQTRDNKERARRAPEGVSAHIPYKGSVKPIIQELIDGLQSGMSYSGSIDIPTFWQKASFVRVTDAGIKESKTRH